MGGKNKAVTVGYWYYMDVLATLCHSGPDDDIEIKELQVGDRTAWSGSITQSQTVTIDARKLFGGEEREGGVEGNMDVMMGEPGMSVNSFLGASMRASGITGPVPAYRRVLSLFFRGQTTDPEFEPSPEFEVIKNTYSLPAPFNATFEGLPQAFRWAALNPYFKKFRVKVRRNWDGWYPEKSRIGNDANPAHIMYESFTNVEWGMGYPAGEFDDTRCKAVADALHAEGFGLSLAWSQQTSIEEFVLFILRHINGVVSQDRVTGKLFFKLIRNDYDTDDLIELGPSNCRVEGYSRPGSGETVNEVVLKYTKRDGKADAVTLQDLAGITNHGQIISQTVELPGIRDASLANRVCQRELESRTKPISKLTIRVNRTAYPLYEGDVFKLTWPAHGILSMVCRVVSIDLGTVTDNTIKIEAIEDVFGMPSNSYVKPQPIGWVDTSQAAVPATIQKAVEASYHEVITQTAEADRNTFVEGFGFAMLMAARPQVDSSRYNLHYSADGTAYTSLGGENWTPTALTTSAVGYLDTIIPISAAIDMHKATPGDVGYLGDELVQLESYSGSSITVKRGIIDTVPKQHALGTRVWFFGEVYAGRDEDIKIEGETAYYKPATVTSQDELPVDEATASSLVFANRYERPYPPGQFQIEGQWYPTEVEVATGLTITWAHRDRVLQADQVVDTTAASIGPEPGVTYSVRLIDAGTATVLQTHDGLTGTTLVTTGPAGVYSLTVELWSVRDGLDSHQKHSHTFAYGGGGATLPDARITEDNNRRITESGDVRITEV